MCCVSTGTVGKDARPLPSVDVVQSATASGESIYDLMADVISPPCMRLPLVCALMRSEVNCCIRELMVVFTSCLLSVFPVVVCVFLQSWYSR